MVYYAASLPTVLSELESWGAVWYLLARGIPIIYKMFAIHIIMGTYWIFSMLEALQVAVPLEQSPSNAELPPKQSKRSFLPHRAGKTH